MPIYTFENTKTGEVYDDMMSIADMEKFLKKNKHIKQRLTTINISSGVQGVNMKNDGGWKDNLSRIAEAHPTSPLADQHRKRSIKEVKTACLWKKSKSTFDPDFCSVRLKTSPWLLQPFEHPFEQLTIKDLQKKHNK